MAKRKTMRLEKRIVYAILPAYVLESENMQISGGIDAQQKITDLAEHTMGTACLKPTCCLIYPVFLASQTHLPERKPVWSRMTSSTLSASRRNEMKSVFLPGDHLFRSLTCLF